MSDEPKTSPLPWKLETVDATAEHCGMVRITSGDCNPAVGFFYRASDAAMVMRAVNTNAELLAAFKTALDVAVREVIEGIDSAKRLVELLDTAIAKATADPP